MTKPLVAVVVGPTASGKSALAVEIAKKYGGEVVSADSMQIYKGMDIATAKPAREEMQGIPHHLISIVEPTDSFSVNEFKIKATQAIEDILSRGKFPVVAGGTGFYVDTLVNNTEFLDYEKNDIRARLEEKAGQEGIAVLYGELKAIDPIAAERLHENDSKRIIRALEVYYSTGKTITEQERLSHLEESPYRFCIIGINARDRQVLYDRINLRVDLMLEAGLISEAREFFSMPVSLTAKQAIGYKELKPYLDGHCSLDEAVERLKTETRRYAKRQLTWLRKRENINWIYIDSKSRDEIINEAFEIIKSFE
ncbi:MAG: tRNA (adenosine(37)-N6)-dimethylallyltransferase MiaA [Ruminococcaceae bacterium]|nr:tRNA (adenosine(37)-N6)-dimethylallyltransferase MiaA [Oscillospiraceae bacterium]